MGRGLHWVWASLLALFLLLPSCGDDGPLLIGLRPIPNATNLTDPSNDTFNSNYYDIRRVSFGVVGTDLEIRITLNQAPMLPPPNSVPVLLGDLTGFIYIDTDQTTGTGNVSTTFTDCPTGQTPIGWEFRINLTAGRLANGDYSVDDTNPTQVGGATPTVYLSTLILTVPLATLGGDDGLVDLEALVGTVSMGPLLTDCIPGTGISTLDNGGDTFGTMTHDILQVGTTHTATDMIFNILFAAPPALPAAGANPGATEVSGFIDIDTDSNNGTGQPPATAGQCMGTGLATIGAEYYVDFETLGRLGDGTYPVYNANTVMQSGNATVSVVGSVLSVTVPLSALGNDDGTALAEMVMGNGDTGPIAPTDCLPDLNPLTKVIVVP